MPQVSFAQHTLDYPPWALDFDPYNRGYLIVGGGGGQGQKEVPNKISVLDLSDRSVIETVADLDVVDDSPASLGLLAAKDGLYAYTGINSSAEDRKAGKNEHLRSFQIKFPARQAKAKGKSPKKASKSSSSIFKVGQSGLFSSTYVKSDDAFQRLLRLSPTQVRPSGNKRIGVIASSLSTTSEIVFFDATVAAPTSKDVIHRIEGTVKDEPNDLDVCEVSDGVFRMTYCTSSAIYLVNLSYDFTKHKLKSKVAEPVLLHEVLAKPSKVRCLRFLSPELILVLVNKGSESDLFILKIHPKGGPGDVILRKKLSKRTGLAVSLDVSSLDPDTVKGDKQVVVAVAAQKHDVNVFSINIPGTGNPTEIKTYMDLTDVHQAPMKKVVLSTFHSPYAVLGNKKPPKKMPEQVIQLASISLSNTLVVDTFPLQPVRTKAKPRYMIDNAGFVSRAVHSNIHYVVAAIVLFISLFLAQNLLDAQAPEGQLSRIQLVPTSLRNYMAGARVDSDPIKNVIQDAVEAATPQRLSDLVPDALAGAVPSTIVVKPDAKGGSLAAEVHDDSEAVVNDPNAKRWDELTKKEQEVWKKRLEKAGRWSAGEGEKILKSIFFSEVAGAIGRAAMEAING